EGTHVEPGDIVVELDSSSLEQERTTQLISVTGQKALHVQAENKLAAAQIARREYEFGIFVSEERLLIADAYVAQQTMSTAEAGLEQARRLFNRAIINAKQVEASIFAVEDARNRLIAAEAKLKNLREFTRDKMLKTFDSDIATASADVSAQEAKLTLEERKLREIEEQIAKCTIRAPVAGEVVHANEYDSNNGNVQADFVVTAGAAVRERQPIIRIPSSKEMQVRATVNQARVTLVKAGMPVTIRVDALKDQLIHGEVVKVNPYADPGSWSSGNIKRYATFVRVPNPPPGLRSGMNAEVRIHIEQEPDALQVPVQALTQHEGRFYGLVQHGENYETREVTIRSTNDKVATIGSGLSQGDIVVMNPRRAGDLLDLPELPSGASQIAKAPRAAEAEKPPSGEDANTTPGGGGE
ncbi:MAG TPA: HlyD family efflux transporter periplasmic adaptor subunit, partial [Pirellulaceae bacterium]|nr:HlyD family efflux transporter periplasmic adaptor subunit [Pirellulaceae bacterium]